MEAYTGFADVYDIFMDNVLYEEWAEYIDRLLNRYGVSKDGVRLFRKKKCQAKECRHQEGKRRAKGRCFKKGIR